MKMRIAKWLVAGGFAVAATAGAETMADPYVWLEEIEGEQALEWVEARNDESLGVLEQLPNYETLYERNLEIYNTDERIAYPTLRGGYVYNFWRDDDNPRGLWRRASNAEYIASDGRPDWDVLLDLDELAEREAEDWVWSGAVCLAPDFERCILRLSRGGADAVVAREFDVSERSFVEDGFVLPEAKSAIDWIDEDQLFVATDFGDGTLTDSGYPRIAKRWRRGEPLADASVVYAGEASDIFNAAYRVRDGERNYDLVRRAPSFFTAHYSLIGADGELTRLEFPDDAVLHTIVGGQLVIELKSDWKPAAETFGQGSLLAISLDRFVNGSRDFQLLVEPTDTSAIDTVTRSGGGFVVSHLDNVTNRLERFELKRKRWRGNAIDAPALGSIGLVASHEDSDDLYFVYEGFLSPDTLYHSRGTRSSALTSLPAFFDTDGMEVRQEFATSADGTRVPYFLVLPRGFEFGEATPTLLYGYGGFEVSLTPSYSATVGHSWLSRGGAYVVANIRGGGEFGPDWHQAALKEHRQRAYDDFAAVAEKLISDGVTTPAHLGIRGGSNGGLLMGVMLTQRPDLFGAVVVQVPLLDMKRFNKLLAGASWMGEYGDPDTDDWEFIRQYSPYQNVANDVDYPSTFFTTSTRDDRVHPGHARKMVALLSDKGAAPLYYENTVGGHAGASDNKQQARLQALVFSYLLEQLGPK